MLNYARWLLFKGEIINVDNIIRILNKVKNNDEIVIVLKDDNYNSIVFQADEEDWLDLQRKLGIK